MVPISVKSLSGPQSYSAAGRIRSFTNTSDLIESQLRDLPTCSAVPQPATLLHVPKNEKAVYEQTWAANVHNTFPQHRMRNFFDLSPWQWTGPKEEE
jgi:hypothetical protein